MLACGCSQSPVGPAASEARIREQLSIPAETPIKDLGVVELSAKVPRQVSLGPGSDCLITPAVLADGTLQLNLASETKTADGKLLRSHSLINLHSGQQCVVSIDGQLVVMTPKLKAE